MLPGWASSNSLQVMVPVGIDPEATISGVMTLNSSTARIGAIFVAPSSQNINGFYAVHQSLTGTVTNILQADLYALDSALIPTGSSLATATYTPTNGWTSVTFSAAYAVTGGTAYAIIIKNVGGTPGSNYCNMYYNSGVRNKFDRVHIRSTDSGTSYKLQHSYWAEAMIWPNYASSGVYGTIPDWVSFENDINNSLYNTSGSRVAIVAAKVQFTCNVKVWGLRTTLGRSGSPTHTLDASIWNDSGTKVSTAANTWEWSTIGSSHAMWQWTTPYELTANTVYYIGVTPTNATAGDSSNYYTIKGCQYLSSALRPAAVGPVLDTVKSTATTPSWSQTGADDAVAKILIFVEDALTGSGGSSSILCQRGMNGGFTR